MNLWQFLHRMLVFVRLQGVEGCACPMCCKGTQMKCGSSCASLRSLPCFGFWKRNTNKSNHHFPTIRGIKYDFTTDFRWFSQGVNSLSEKFWPFAMLRNPGASVSNSAFLAWKWIKGLLICRYREGIGICPCLLGFRCFMLLFFGVFWFQAVLEGGWGNVTFNEKGLQNYKNTSF